MRKTQQRRVLSLVHARSLRTTDMSAPKKYTWDDLKSAEAKTKEGILMLIHGKGQSRSTLYALEYACIASAW